MGTSERAYRVLLHLYPSAFRTEYGDEMASDFAARLRDESAWRVWPRTIVETVWTAAREHADVTRRDVRVAARGLSRTPTLAIVVVLVLALGIGSSTAVYTVVRHILWEPLPFAAPERLVVVLQDGRGPVAPATLEDLRAEAGSLAAVAGAELWGPTWTGAAHPERLTGMHVTPNLFDVLGVPAAIGRTPTPGDTRVLVISHRLWQERFGGDRAVVGRELVLEGERHTIIGVMPPTFVFSPFWARAEAWGVEDLSARRNDRRGASWRVFARLRGDASVAAARQDVAALSSRLAQRHPQAHRDLRLQVASLQDRVTGDVRPLPWTLLVAVGCVLLVTCANVASLLLARAGQRQQEMAVRSALGGRSGVITRQLLTESLLLAGAGAALGLALAAWLVSIVPSLTPLGLPRLDTVAVDGRMLLVAATTSLCTGVLFGLAPVWSVRRAIRLGTRGSTDSRGTRRLRAGFVIGEVVVAIVLVVGAGLLVRSFQRLIAIDPGFRPDGVLAVEISAASSSTWRHDRGPLFRQVVDRVRAVPGVTSA